jgi:2'-5' RNA ligase
MARLFYSLWPDDCTRARVLEYSKQCCWNGAAAVDAAKFHITLKFLGEVEEQKLAPLDALPPGGTGPFELHLTQPSVWNGGVAVLHARSDEILGLHQRLDQALQELGFPAEARPYRPHLTLARRAPSAKLPKLSPIPWRVPAFYLVRSRSQTYEILREFALG